MPTGLSSRNSKGFKHRNARSFDNVYWVIAKKRLMIEIIRDKKEGVTILKSEL